MTVRSQNGWPANDINLTSSRLVPGSNRKLRVVNGPAGDLLLWVASQFDKLVEDIDPGQLDDWGYAERAVRGGTDLSNHASGTAIDLDALRHILGSRAAASFTAKEIATIHAILNRTRHNGRNLVRWGGDYVGRTDPMHFEINNGVTAAECAAVLNQLTHPPAKKDDDMPSLDEIAHAVAAYDNPAVAAAKDAKGKPRDVYQLLIDAAAVGPKVDKLTTAITNLTAAINAQKGADA